MSDKKIDKKSEPRPCSNEEEVAYYFLKEALGKLGEGIISGRALETMDFLIKCERAYNHGEAWPWEIDDVPEGIQPTKEEE